MTKRMKPKALVCKKKPSFSSKAMLHIMRGDVSGDESAHSGLHSMFEVERYYPNIINDAECRVATDSRCGGIYVADVKLSANRKSKRSSFFPRTMNWLSIKAVIESAWQDYNTYKSNQIYVSMRKHISWAGMAKIDGQKIWIGSLEAGTKANPINTAFPAVNNKFYRGITDVLDQ